MKGLAALQRIKRSWFGLVSAVKPLATASQRRDESFTAATRSG